MSKIMIGTLVAVILIMSYFTTAERNKLNDQCLSLQTQNDSLRIANYTLQEKLTPKPKYRVSGFYKPGKYLD